MSESVLDQHQFEAAVRKRYGVRPPCVSSPELDKLLGESTFKLAIFVAEYIDQMNMIVERLGEGPDPDLVLQGKHNLERLHVLSQKLATELPHVVLEPSGDNEST